MTTSYDTKATNPNPPAGDVQPVNVRITHVDPGVQLGGQAPASPKRHRKIKTTYTTVIFNNTGANPVQPLLPASDKRISAQIIVHAGVGAGTNGGSYGWLTDSESSAIQAAAASNAGLGAVGAYISAGGTIVAYPIKGQNAVWCAVDSAATGSLVISVIADYYED